MGNHINEEGAFQSDKYPWCKPGFVPLKIGDPMATDLLIEYARRRKSVDEGFTSDLLSVLEHHVVPDAYASDHEVRSERWRQIEVEGWSAEHDDKNVRREMADAASCYAAAATIEDAEDVMDDAFIKLSWPWDWKWFKPSTPMRNLQKAGALILAEMDRLRRLTRHG